MLSFLSGFLIVNLLYHILITIGVYGLEICGTFLPALLREGIWCLFLIIIFLFNIKYLKSYRKQRKRCRITFAIVLLFSVSLSYLIKEKNLNDIFIGIKYGFRWIFMLLSSTTIGYFYQKNVTKTSHLQRIKRGLITTIIIGFLRQGTKLLFPEFFFKLGYGPLNDFHFLV